MNKEDVRQKMLDIVGDIFHANEAIFSKPLTFDGHTWEEAKDTINKSFDRITVDHPKVKLPREVGEELDEYKRGFEHDIDVLYLLVDVDNLSELLKTNKWLYDSDGYRSEHANRLIDAYRYGWEAEPEAKWYVKTPESWESEDGDFGWLYKSIYGGVDTTSHIDGEESDQFTRAEIKQYHLDSDIFTLVPVEADKEVSR